jgi:5-methylcytosine-specific restriction protein B
MKLSHRSPLPLAPLLRAYLAAGPPTGEELGRIPIYGERVRAVLAAPRDFFYEGFLETASEPDFAAALGRFYAACVQPPLHAEALRRRAGFLRHALGHLLRCPDPLPIKAERCLALGGPYHVLGLGPAFWSALFQALDATQCPSCTPAILGGLRRLGLATWPTSTDAAGIYRELLTIYGRLLNQTPGISALHLDHFFSLVAVMQGRDLWSGAGQLSLPLPGVDLPALLRQERARLPLRRRLKERGQVLAAARKQLEVGLVRQDGEQLGAALRAADPAGSARTTWDWASHGEALTLWVGRLWEADDPYEMLEAYWRADPLPGSGLWLPAAVLHLRDPDRYHAWSDAARQGHALLADGSDTAGPPAERYRLFNEAVGCLREQLHLHPLEAPAFLAAVAEAGEEIDRVAADGFGGFCSDTFRFLEELGQNNSRTWMNGQRDRYHFAVRQPLVELCQALAERYVRPVLQGQWGWELETAARSGKALTSIVKNDYGRSVPYHTVLWIAFCRRDQGGRRNEAQFFVRLDRSGLSFGLRLGREAREAGRLLRRNVQEHAELLHQALNASEALSECRFGQGEDLATAALVRSPGDLRGWAAGKSLIAGKHLPAEDPLLTSEELVGEILLTFDRLLPAYACAVSEGPGPVLSQRARLGVGASFTEDDFCRTTFLPAAWLRRARALLDLKRQLILQGVPGTGKTFVARMLARLLTQGREGAVRLVQFHPAYSYEEFVEGIKAKSVDVGGRHEVTYPVEDGLLAAFAAEAARFPAEPFVLIIDEINRGNLPRIFGELLYLLEYRGQSVALPYSKRSFRLPANLYLLGTMNAADRSVALVDQALRRRFSFLEMPPDPTVLAAWLRANPPRGGPEFAGQMVALFERLNKNLIKELGPQGRVGHSYFMAPDLDEDRLRVIWEHHVLPFLEEHFPGQPDRLAAYELDRLWKTRKEPMPQDELMNQLAPGPVG